MFRDGGSKLHYVIWSPTCNVKWTAFSTLRLFFGALDVMGWLVTKASPAPLSISDNNVCLNSTSGTICDLSGKPRVTRILYVCYAHGKHEVYSFKETSTCEYEIIILSPLLCEHPQFKPKDVSELAINCIPVGDAPKKPRNLLKMEVDSLRFHHQTIKFLNTVSWILLFFGPCHIICVMFLIASCSLL